MREILFRGKRVDTGSWLYGDLRHWPSGAVGIHCEVTHNTIKVIPETVGQYTGLTDRNGKRIFEGDICCFKEWNEGKMCWVGEVKYAHQQFIISGGANEECEVPFVLQLSRFIPECIEVIGNVHDNPDLIGGHDDGK